MTVRLFNRKRSTIKGILNKPMVYPDYSDWLYYENINGLLDGCQ